MTNQIPMICVYCGKVCPGRWRDRGEEWVPANLTTYLSQCEKNDKQLSTWTLSNGKKIPVTHHWQSV